ncbi:hypothetical protein B9Q13_01105 [Candidatus Marsarchaeota G2 archaeon ECH_B_SAG-G16]|jgi:hypothetical protein|uniref:Uncharacterized protein n=4 Tax=Candidatus Marsarchaeota TaxID=1978152 RepID=A0A2R6C2T5_9ARCH|nr:MAG: hypothetical protein B9Q01_09430 [Candidatus Marsarchaeota G1 archaeon OSP_D]PSN87200.1 MAG: hypothetical protein B9Q00_09475 [Candidatus Marsarchaeota G1 archaeon OSP_C]PSO05183.1 MAG: hypothetical protein B9Q12_00980 [Candidatus Marsarchaeota G2 archaeon ECH_B_SAG-G06]PSO05707.1 MAG: hypothetical protein B9Q13_01105 [Candidatus Marsarchaeota G2 archaeon ECH_B_SAG-G16]
MEKALGKKKPLAKEWILFFIWKKGGWKGSISELSRALGYSSDSYTNTKVSELVREGCLRVEEGKVYKVTAKGLWRIRAFTAALYGPLVLALFALIPEGWAIELLLFRVIISPLSLSLTAVLIFSFSLWIFRSVGRIIESFLSRDESLETSEG